MQKAYEQALLARAEDEVPVGAVLVGPGNQLLGLGRNAPRKTKDPSAHAEMKAIREASQRIDNYRLLGCTLYVTLEPCVMCAGLLVHARIYRLVFACKDLKTGAAGSVLDVLKGAPLNHRVIVDEGLMQEPCSLLLTDFFKARRGEQVNR